MSTDTAKKRIRKTPEQRLEALRTQIAKTEKKVRDKGRQEDARRKIILGGGVLAWAMNGDADARRLLGKMMAAMKDREKDELKGLDLAGAYGADANLLNEAERTQRLMAKVTEKLFGEPKLKVGEASGLAALEKLDVLNEIGVQRLRAHWAKKNLHLGR